MPGLQHKQLCRVLLPAPQACFSRLHVSCAAFFPSQQLKADWPIMSELVLIHSLHLYRSHPEEVRKFYALIDEFHRMWDVVTEFDSLSHLATQMIPVSVAMAHDVIMLVH